MQIPVSMKKYTLYNNICGRIFIYVNSGLYNQVS